MSLLAFRRLPEFSALLLEVAAKWQTKWPEEAGRIAMGRQIVESGAVTSAGPGAFDVVGSGTNWYTVRVSEGLTACTCLYHKNNSKHNRRCKHSWAAALISRVIELLEEQLPTEEPPPGCGAGKPRRIRRPLASEMGRLCAKLHQRNAQLNAKISHPEQIEIQRC